jgi:hypothetical protein
MNKQLFVKFQKRIYRLVSHKNTFLYIITKTRYYIKKQKNLKAIKSKKLIYIIIHAIYMLYVLIVGAATKEIKIKYNESKKKVKI